MCTGIGFDLGVVWGVAPLPNVTVSEGPIRLGQPQTRETTMELLLWILAVILVVAGVLALFRHQVLWGVVLIIVGLLVGPGGVSIFT